MVLLRLTLAAGFALIASNAAAQPAPSPSADTISASACQFANGYKVLLSDRSPDEFIFVMQVSPSTNLLARIYINDDQTISVDVQDAPQEDPARSRAIEMLFEELRFATRQQLTRTQFAAFMQTGAPTPCARTSFHDYFQH